MTDKTCRKCSETKTEVSFGFTRDSRGKKYRSNTCRKCYLISRNLSTVRCSVIECDNPNLARTLCRKHYNRWRQGMPIAVGDETPHPLDAQRDERKRCSLTNCERISEETGGLCCAHSQRKRKNGDPGADKPIIVRGARRYIDSDGYVVLRADGHPNGSKNGSIFEHVRVMSDHIGRPLNPGETVHHKYGVRDDNRIENLELWSGNHPRGARVADHIRWALNVLDQYGTDPKAWEN